MTKVSTVKKVTDMYRKLEPSEKHKVLGFMMGLLYKGDLRKEVSDKEGKLA